jgi:hypothetical protein
VRTTLTLDDDVSARIEREQQRSKLSFKALINDLLRAGLEARRTPRPNATPFRTDGFALGASLVGSLDNIEEVLSRTEGEDHS